jgi:uncharacterized protein YbgA (DUF1722 family)
VAPSTGENFIERMLSRNRWRNLDARGLRRRRLVELHTEYKLLVRAQNEAIDQRLGKLVGSAGEVTDRAFFSVYDAESQGALRTRATAKKNVNVLQHALGDLKKQLSSVKKRGLLAAIEDYGLQLLPLVVPRTLLRYNVTRYVVDDLAGLLYFDPHPKELDAPQPRLIERW